MPCDQVSIFKADFDPKRERWLQAAAAKLGLKVATVSAGVYAVNDSEGDQIATIANGQITATRSYATLANDLRVAYADVGKAEWLQAARAKGWQVQQMPGQKVRVFKT